MTVVSSSILDPGGENEGSSLPLSPVATLLAGALASDWTAKLPGQFF